MKLSESLQRRSRIAALVAGGAFLVLFAGMLIGSQLTHKSPGRRWMGLFGLLLFFVAADQIVNNEAHAKRNNELPNKQWPWVQHRPAFYIVLGAAGLAFVALLIVLNAANLFSGPWFD